MKMTKEEAFKMLQGKKVYAGEYNDPIKEKLMEIGFVKRGSTELLYNGKFIVTFESVFQTYYSLEYYQELSQEEITISQILGIELEDEFKNGDICYSNNGACKMIFIYKKLTDKQNIDYYACLVIENYELLLDDWCDTSGNIRNATDQEKQTLFNELDKQGYKWNSEEKKLEKKLWRAEYNGFYYIISDDLSVNLIQEENDSSDNIYYDIKNYFKTKDEAQQYADKIEDLLKNR